MPIAARRALLASCLLALGGLGCVSSRPGTTPSVAGPRPLGIELVGHLVYEPGPDEAGAVLGGLSGIVYDAASDRYLAVSDDKGDFGPPRFYSLCLDPFAPSVRIEGWTALEGVGPAAEPVDPEGIALAPDGTVFVSSEGLADVGIPPFIRRYDRQGRELERLALPVGVAPGAGVGVRHNLALESLLVDVAAGALYTASENALAQDGPTATPEHGSSSRIFRYDLAKGEWSWQGHYRVDATHQAPPLSGMFRTNGLVELLALGDGELLTLERSFVLGVGFSVRLYRISLAGAPDVSAVPSLAAGEGALYKELVLDLADLGVPLQNLEGMTFGPRLPDGRRLLVMVSDDNFAPPLQRTLFLFLALGGA